MEELGGCKSESAQELAEPKFGVRVGPSGQSWLVREERCACWAKGGRRGLLCLVEAFMLKAGFRIGTRFLFIIEVKED